MNSSFGDKLKTIRLERGMTQEELATLFSTSKQVISRYETNQRTPKITVAQEYADKLNVPLSYLIDNGTSSHLTIDEKQKMIFSKNLNNCLSKSGKTQNEVATALGILTTTLKSWCKGKSLPRMGEMQLLSDYFGVKKSDLIEEYTLEKKNPEELSKRVKKEISEELKKFEESLMNADGLMLDGELASEETVQNLLSAMKIGMEIARKKNKEKFTPKKYK